MKKVIFVAPYFLPATIRFIEAVAEIPGTQTGLISQDPAHMLPKKLQLQLAAHERVAFGLDPQQILNAARLLSTKMGGCDRLFGALEDLQVPLAQVREAMGIEGLTVEAANNFRDKSTMKTVMRAAGIPCARHKLITSPTEGLSFLQEVGFPIVAKPPAGAGARNTSRLESMRDFYDYLTANIPTPSRPTLLEEFIQGDEFTFDSISIHGKVVWHSITRYFPTPLEVLKNPWIQWCVLLPREVDHPRFLDIRQAAAKALSALGMTTGLNHMEWFRRKDGSIAISEVAARPPGAQITSLHSYAHDFDLYRAWAKLMVYDTFDIPQKKFSAGVAFIRGMGQGRVKAVHGLDVIARELGNLVIEAKLPKPGQPKNTTYEGEGYIMVRHPDTEIVMKALKLLITTIRVEIA